MLLAKSMLATIPLVPVEGFPDWRCLPPPGRWVAELLAALVVGGAEEAREPGAGQEGRPVAEPGPEPEAGPAVEGWPDRC